MGFSNTLQYILQIANLTGWSTASEKSWKRLQQKRLQYLVRHAKERSPFYRKHWSNVDLSNFRLQDLPPVHKVDLAGKLSEHLTISNFPHADVQDFMSDAANLGKWFRDKYCVYQTSGTHGLPLTVVQDQATMRVVFACLAARSRLKKRPSVGELFEKLREPKRVAFLTTQPGFFPSSAAMNLLPYFAGRLLELRLFSILNPSVALELAEFKPHSVLGYAGSLDYLSRSCGSLGSQLEQINNSSEQLTDAIRQRLESTFKVPVLDHYGSGECLQLADVCQAGQMHVNADWAILEPVDEEFRPVAPGEISKRVLVTNLANKIQPFIRYVIDDRVQIREGRCRCGSTFPVVEALHGRSSDQIIVRSEQGVDKALPGILFQNVTDHHEQITEWRIVQESQTRLVLEWKTSLDSSESESNLFREIEKNLRQQGLPDFVELTSRPLQVATLDTKSGKHKRIKPLAT